MADERFLSDVHMQYVVEIWCVLHRLFRGIVAVVNDITEVFLHPLVGKLRWLYT